MPGKKRRIHSGVSRRLHDEPYRFEFFQAVRVLLAWHRHNSSEQDQDVLGQIIRFRSSVSLAFPPSEIESLTIESKNGEPRQFSAATLTPSLIGLTGPLGVMPRHYTQHVAEREIYHRDTATRAFLDIFSTRAIALFYQAWLKCRLHLQYEADRESRFLPMMLSLAGMGLPGMRDRLEGESGGIADQSLAYYASALRARPQSVQWFARVATDYFRVACRAEQFIGQWFKLAEHEYSRLGTTHCILGGTAFCGDRVWDRQTRMRLILGPMRKHRFDDFLPGGRAANSLKQLFRLMVGTISDCEVKLILDRRDAAPMILGASVGAARLGWSAWIGTRDTTRDSCDVGYLIEVAS